MKTKSIRAKLLGLVIVVLLLQSTAGMAQSNIQLSLYKPNAKIAEVKVEGLEKDTETKVTLTNEYGTVLFSDKSNGDRYVKMLDFANVKNGVYFLDITKDKGMIRKHIIKDNNGLSFEEEAYVFHNLVKFEEEDKKLFVKFNNQLKEPVTLRLTDRNGKVLHEIADIKDVSYAALFNLSQLHSGLYNMTVTSGSFSNFKQIQL